MKGKSSFQFIKALLVNCSGGWVQFLRGSQILFYPLLVGEGVKLFLSTYNRFNLYVKKQWFGGTPPQ